MKRKTTNILLLISLVFNIAVLTVFSIHIMGMKKGIGFHPTPNGARPEIVRKHFREVRGEHKNYMRLKRDFIKTLMNEQANNQILLEKLDKTVAAQMAMEREIGYHLIEMRNEMSLQEFRHCFRRDRFSPELFKKRVIHKKPNPKEIKEKTEARK